MDTHAHRGIAAQNMAGGKLSRCICLFAPRANVCLVVKAPITVPAAVKPNGESALVDPLAHLLPMVA